MRGYKVFNSDWTCRGKKYEVGKTYEEDVKLKVCGKGMHFCERLVDCFNYYTFDPRNKVAEVIAHGNIETDGDKSCTDKLEIVRELSWADVLNLVNTGDSNTGDWNTGDSNTGHRNTGHRNTGFACASDFDNGVFNTKSDKIRMFNKQSELTLAEFYGSEYYNALYRGFELTKWVRYEDLKEEDRNEETKALGGKLYEKDYKQAWKDKWELTREEDRKIIKSMPNFDPEIFFEITGIEVQYD